MKRLLIFLILALMSTSTFAQTPDAPLLTETYIAAPQEAANDGGTGAGETLTFRYPQGWTVRETVGQFLIANTADLTQLSATPIPDDVAGLALVIVNGDSLPEGVEATPQGVADFFREATRLSGVENVNEDEFQLGAADAFSLEASTSNEDVLLLVVALEDGAFAVFNGATTSGTLDAVRSVFYAIAASVEYTPDVVPQITLGANFTETFETNTFTIMHPVDWKFTQEADQVSFSGVVESGVDEQGEPVGGALAGAVILFPPDTFPATISLEQIASVYRNTLLDDEGVSNQGDNEEAEIVGEDNSSETTTDQSTTIDIITNGRDAVLFSEVSDDSVTLVVIARTGGTAQTVAIVVGVYDLALDAEARLALARFAGTIDAK